MVRTINLPADWSHQLLRKGRARGHNDRWGKAAEMQVEKPGPGSRVMLDTSTIGFEPPWKNEDVGRLCRNPSAGEEACVPEKLYYSKGPCLGSWLLQWLLVPPKQALQCY